MSQPQVTLTELDGALGVLPPSAGKLLALVGPATAGPINTPATYGRVPNLISTFTSGPLVEAAAYFVETFGRPVIVVRTAASTAGVAGAVDSTGKTGTSVITLTGTPVDDQDVEVRFLTGGTIGVTGITFQYSLDGGRTWSAVINLGTATTYAVPGSGVTLNFAAGTIIAADQVSAHLTAPAWSTSELGAGVDALAASAASWEMLEVVGPIDGNAIDSLELKFAAMQAAGKYRSWRGNTRIPNDGESEATYLAAMNTAFSSKVTTFGGLCAGGCKLTSSVSGRKYRRPISYVVAAREAAVSEEINIAALNTGALKGVSIRDANGNPDEHDESNNPGLDDARFTVLRTWDNEPGVYVNRPRLFSSPSSDFQLMPHRRVMNLGHSALRTYFTRRLNSPILVAKATGFILEEEALEIEAGAMAILRDVLLAKPKASATLFALARNDNLLSTKTLTGDMRVVPLAYPEFITLTVGFINPALQVQAV
jgi:Protein of unknown function (DUF2586)